MVRNLECQEFMLAPFLSEKYVQIAYLLEMIEEVISRETQA